jgi:hypothetical protein
MEKYAFDQLNRDRDEDEILGAVAGVRIELDDDQEDAEAIHPIERFPIYVRYLIGRGIHDRDAETFPYVLGDSDLTQFEPPTLAYHIDELADSMPPAITHGRGPATTGRRRSYLRLAAIALRHFHDDPGTFELCVDVIHAVAKQRNAAQ